MKRNRAQLCNMIKEQTPQDLIQKYNTGTNHKKEKDNLETWTKQAVPNDYVQNDTIIETTLL